MNHRSSGDRISSSKQDENNANLVAATTEHLSCTIPRSDAVSGPSDETILLEFALCLCCDQTPDDALSRAIATLSELLPNCAVSVCGLDTANSVPPASERRSHSSITVLSDLETKGGSAWVLNDHPKSPTLVISLDNCRSPHEVGRRLTLGEQVVTLLTSAFRRNGTPPTHDGRASELARLLERVLQAEKLAQYGQAVAGIIHDLNNPLTAILAYADYLCRSLPAQNVAETDLERLHRIREAAERVLTQTRSLVEYARPSSSQVVAVDLGRLVQNALIFCEHEITQAKLHTELCFDELGFPIPGIPGQLTQLFVNLFTNAAHAVRGNQAILRVECSVERELGYVLIRVSDNGIGITATDLERIFDPFFTTKSDGRGFGLGLSIVREIVLNHRGAIHVESTLQVGTTFSIRLPLSRASESQASP